VRPESSDKPNSVRRQDLSISKTWWSFIWARRYRRARATYPGTVQPKPERNERSASPPPYLVLLHMGFTMPPPSPVERWALTPPFHPCRAGRACRRRSTLCCTFRRVAAPRRYRACCRRSSDFPPRANARSDHLELSDRDHSSLLGTSCEGARAPSHRLAPMRPFRTRPASRPRRRSAPHRQAPE